MTLYLQRLYFDQDDMLFVSMTEERCTDFKVAIMKVCAMPNCIDKSFAEYLTVKRALHGDFHRLNIGLIKCFSQGKMLIFCFMTMILHVQFVKKSRGHFA